MLNDPLEQNKETVRRLVDRVINEWHVNQLDSIFTPDAAVKAHEAFTSFRTAFPDWQMDLIELVAEREIVVARFKCRGTN